MHGDRDLEDELATRLRAELDSRSGPHRTWAEAPAARVVMEHPEETRWRRTPFAAATLAAGLVVVLVGVALLRGTTAPGNGSPSPATGPSASGTTSPMASPAAPSTAPPTAPLTLSPSASLSPAATASPTPGSLAVQTDTFFARFTGTGIPGCAAAISQGGAVVYKKGFGLADYPARTPITPSTTFLSTTGVQITDAEVLFLVDEGKLSLDNDIHRYVPSLPNYGTPVTLRDLLYHMSGIPGAITLAIAAGRSFASPFTDADALAILRQNPKLLFAPGSRFAYSNSDEFLLGLTIEKVAGEDLSAFAATNVFGPLGMASTYLDGHPPPSPPPAAISYQYVVGAAPKPDPYVWSLSDGGFQTTVLDLLRWAGSFETGAFGGAALLRAMAVPGPYPIPADYFYLGGQALPGSIRVTNSNLTALVTGGGIAGFTDGLVIVPARHFAVAVLCNSTVTPLSINLALGVVDLWLGTGFEN